MAAPAGPTAAEMRALMEEAITAAAPDTASPEEIKAMVEAAVKGATASQVTGADIQSAVAGAVADAVGKAVAGQAVPLSAAEVAKIVDAAVKAIPTPATIEVVRTVIVTETITETIIAEAETTPPYWHPDTRFYGNPVYGGQIRINYEDPLDHANLWGAHSGVTVRYRMPVMNSIVADDPYQSGVIIPDLAKDWQGDSDLKGITINFEDDIKWHNGDVFTCEDARFTIQTMITGEGITAPEMAGKLSNVDLAGTSCSNDSTLKLAFKGPSSTPLLPFLDRAFLIFNKAWFLEGGEDAMFTDVSVGTGPYIWGAGQSVGNDEQLFERNPDYFKPGLPYTDSILLFGILDESIQQASMLAHLTDWHWVRNFGQYDSYVDHDQIQTVIRATRGHHSIWLNKGNPPLDNVKVRQAIYMGIDRGAAIKVLLAGHGSQGFIMPPGGAWDLTQAEGCAIPAWCAPADFDAQRAEAISILEGEGFDFDKVFIFTVEADEQVQARATFIQEQLNLLGIKTEFDTVETVAYREQTSDGTWGDILPRNDTMPADDPALGMGFYMRCISPNNHWTPQLPCDDKAEGLLDLAASTVDPKDRKAISDELQIYIMEQYWKFPLYWEQEAVAFWPEVRGYAHHPQPSGAFVRWEQLWLDPSHADDTGFSGQTTGVPGGQ
ncbi:MAG: ABC transporter substrate-binding protein [Chloroflexi bacterium]|nr:ABC transporter substrate-binding protein [Chloroflexota bacterium]